MFLLPERGLDHLVIGAVASGEELMRKAESEVIDDFSLLEREQGLVIAARRLEAF